MPEPTIPVAVWRCERCGYDRVEYVGDDASHDTWLCEDPCCRGSAWTGLYPPEDRQLERIPVVVALDGEA